jgi:hypothetical protein
MRVLFVVWSSFGFQLRPYRTGSCHYCNSSSRATTRVVNSDLLHHKIPKPCSFSRFLQVKVKAWASAYQDNARHEGRASLPSFLPSVSLLHHRLPFPDYLAHHRTAVLTSKKHAQFHAALTRVVSQSALLMSLTASKRSGDTGARKAASSRVTVPVRGTMGLAQRNHQTNH